MSSLADDELRAAARAARANAYAPYSRFGVGAALRCGDGTIVTACNVENVSYGLTICAERAAVFAAVASGHVAFEALAICGPDGSTTAPCGACRQVLAEFGVNLRVLYGERETTLDALLPERFDVAPGTVQ